MAEGRVQRLEEQRRPQRQHGRRYHHRQQNGLAPLSPSDTLDRAAAWKSQNMAANSYFAHDDTPINRTWIQRIRDCGYGYNAYLGENIAAGTRAERAPRMDLH